MIATRDEVINNNAEKIAYDGPVIHLVVTACAYKIIPSSTMMSHHCYGFLLILMMVLVSWKRY